MYDDLLTCAIMSSPPEDIFDTLFLLREQDSPKADLTGAPLVKATSEVVLDPMYTPVDDYFPYENA